MKFNESRRQTRQGGVVGDGRKEMEGGGRQAEGG